jgi:alpha-D-xyloside xylohydrolase
LDDQYMFGSTYLVAPVTTYGASNRSVYLPLLPAGEQWVYYYDSSVVLPSGQRHVISTPLDEFPLFLRGAPRAE